MKNRRLFWTIVERIESLIDSGQYPAGSRLPPERELAENFEVSRPTIREAIIALEVLEQVEVKTGSGVYVLENSKKNQTLTEMEKGANPEAADKEFHLIISTATRNSAILMAVNSLWTMRETSPTVKLAYKGVCSQSDVKRLDEHRAIYNALQNRNSQAARAAMHLHFNRLINALFEASEAKALEEVRRQTSQTRDLYSLSHLVS